jgi:membrane associated rhomboid family serine protease
LFQRKTSGSVVCPSCGSLVGVRDDKCYSCGRANPGLWGFAPAIRALGRDMGFVPLVIGASVTLYVVALLASGSNIIGTGMFTMLSPDYRALMWLGASGAFPVFVEGKWWTVLSATWLHAGILHILFNMMWVRNLGPSAVDIIGPGRTVIIYVVAGVAGFVLSSVMGAYAPALPLIGGGRLGITVGASASVFGLIGALMHYGRVSGSRLIREETKGYAIMGIVAGLLLPGIDNYAHLGGFLGGYGTSMFFNPLTRERGDHVVIAIICLVATFVAIAASIMTGFGRFAT